MRAPIRPIRDRWPAAAERRLQRFFWLDPTVVLAEDPSADDFREAMSALHVGGTIKITGIDRHRLADQLLLDHVDLEGATIVDIGASDGSTSADLVAKLPPTFKAFTIADLYLHLEAVRVGRHVVIFGADASPILVAGRRLVAWPSLSAPVRTLYARILRRARRCDQREHILLLNPRARALLADTRITYRTHDVFTPWLGPKPDVIKVANLLRRLYFSDADIERALKALLSSLDENGYLLIVDNPRIAGIDERAGLYRRQNGVFEPVVHTEHAPEIHALVTATSLA